MKRQPMFLWLLPSLKGKKKGIFFFFCGVRVCGGQGSNFSRLHEKDLDTLERRRREDEKSFVFDSNVSVFFSVPFLPQQRSS